MKITDILVKEMSFLRRKVFKIAFTQSMHARGVYVKVFTDAGLAGMGEAVPMPFVTGETIGGVVAAIEHMKPALLGAEVEDIATIHAIMDRQIAGNTAAKAAIRAAVGADTELRIDFNQGYDFETAAYMLGRLPEFGITEAEQPVPAWDVESMAKLKKISPVLLMADESVHSPREAQRVCREDACHVVNIKLMKCGGIYPALQIADVAKRYGKPCILGCMSETKLGIAAGAAVVAARADQMGVVDLDAFLNFADTGAGVTGGLTVEGDVIRLSDKPGLGFDEFEM